MVHSNSMGLFDSGTGHYNASEMRCQSSRGIVAHNGDGWRLRSPEASITSSGIVSSPLSYSVSARNTLPDLSPAARSMPNPGTVAPIVGASRYQVSKNDHSKSEDFSH